MAAVGNPHDGFFRRVLRDAQAARAFLATHLPAEIVALLGSEPPELVDGSFVDSELRQHHSDVLFRVPLAHDVTAGGEAGSLLAYVLLEHKSAPDRLTPLQVLRYMVNIWRRWLDDGHGLPLPLIVPVVVHNGPDGWSGPIRFSDLLANVAEPAAGFIPDFAFRLVDLARLPDDRLAADARLATLLAIMKYVLRRDLAAEIERLLATVWHLDAEEASTVLIYLEAGAAHLDGGELFAAARRSAETQGDDAMTIMERFKEAGKAEYWAKGRAEGKAEMLLRQLTRRFGPLPVALHQRITTAEPSELDVWADRVIDAPDLASVLAER